MGIVCPCDWELLPCKYIRILQLNITMYSVRLDNNKNDNYHLNFGQLPQVGEWAQYGDAL